MTVAWYSKLQYVSVLVTSQFTASFGLLLSLFMLHIDNIELAVSLAMH